MTTLTVSEQADILDKAAEVIETRGWTRGTLVNYKGCVCTVGAINVAVTGNPFSGCYDSGALTAVDALRDELKKSYNFYNVAEWNDAQRDRRKVTRMLRRTARNLRKSIPAPEVPESTDPYEETVY